jgi:hypothetical protein
MDLHRSVGGLLVRDAVLGTLLLNYAERLAHGSRRPGGTAPCFIVPSWGSAPWRGAAPGSELFTVEAHAFRGDPHRDRNLGVILHLGGGSRDGERPAGRRRLRR